MAVSKAQQRATAKYEAKAYDKTLIRLPKGELDEIKAHAAARGESVNGFIGRAISEAMERDGGGKASESPTEGPQARFGAGVVSLYPQGQKRAGEAADAAEEGKAEVWVSGRLDLPPKMRDAVEGLTGEGETPVAVLWRAIAALDAETVQAAGVVALPVETVEAARTAADRAGESVENFIRRAIEEQAARGRRRRKSKADSPEP